ncbi:hypothetical protein RMS29_028440 (plasmid) [Agrobacterium rosae]|uniref:Integrase n=1 Tax=Agrobacterium rosae TaxID=1972867 RepID=A0ABU4W7H5_9HYPH|nr:hypothetical protein [Agrobacterium rosae]MDX8332866.1 hypothetical protein [Agrobacterium rosae]
MATKPAKRILKPTPTQRRDDWQPTKVSFRLHRTSDPVSLPAISMFQADKKAKRD